MKASLFRILIITLLAQATLLRAVIAEEDFVSDDALFGEEIVGDGLIVQDPLEAINRVIFKINDFVYVKVLDPFAASYSLIVPDPVEKSASNFFHNLKYPVRLVGNLLQGNLNGSWVETGRFLVNSTVGLAGILTPADQFESLQPVPEQDVGRALAARGIGKGPYLVLPLFGPSNLRDLIGQIGGHAVHPLIEPFSVWKNWEARSVYSGSSQLANSPKIVDQYMALKGAAIDPYSAIKHAYMDSRQHPSPSARQTVDSPR